MKWQTCVLIECDAEDSTTCARFNQDQKQFMLYCYAIQQDIYSHKRLHANKFTLITTNTGLLGIYHSFRELFFPSSISVFYLSAVSSALPHCHTRSLIIRFVPPLEEGQDDSLSLMDRYPNSSSSKACSMNNAATL